MLDYHQSFSRTEGSILDHLEISSGPEQFKMETDWKYLAIAGAIITAGALVLGYCLSYKASPEVPATQQTQTHTQPLTKSDLSDELRLK